MTESKCWVDAGLKTSPEAMYIENHLDKGTTPVMFMRINSTIVRHFMYHSVTKIERFSRYKQLYNHIKTIREKNYITFGICKLKDIINQPNFIYTQDSLDQLLEITEFLNKHFIPSDRHYKSKMLHLWSTTPRVEQGIYHKPS